MEVIADALKDTLSVFLCIFILYIIIELLETMMPLSKSRRMLSGELAPLIGAATGIIPQCGFSVMAAKMYDKGLIKTGTIIAVFLATSDEALIILLGETFNSPLAAQSILPLILIKLGVALFFGYLINFILAGEKVQSAPISPVGLEHSNSCGREHEGKSAVRVFFVDPLLHSLQIAAYILLVNLVFGFIIDAVGEESVEAAVIIGGPYVQPLITAAVGLIPNCASSTVITEAFVRNGILFGSMIAGLCSNAGLGLMVLLKNFKKVKRNILLIITLYCISVVVGMIINAVSIGLGIGL